MQSPSKPQKRTRLWMLVALTLVGATFGASRLVAQVAAGAPTDQFTPVIASTLTSRGPAVLGTDGRKHLVYELQLVNARALPATINRIAALDAGDPTRAVGVFAGADLLARIRAPASGSTSKPVIEPNGNRLVLIDLAFDGASPVPSRIVHRIDVTAAAGPAATTATPLSYVLAPFDVVDGIAVLGPPLKGNRWVAVNGCCAPGGAHRSTVLPVNGGLHCTQRFAIDWMQLDDQGRMVHGDPSDVRNYTNYGSDVIAVAAGTVVDALDSLPDQVPGQLPDPKTITVQNVDGNHVVVDHGNGQFAFYAHLKPGSVAVRVGDRVQRGQLLGNLGNTGNSSAPHLHFHLMDGPSVLGSSGLPYVFDGFEFVGQISPVEFAADDALELDWTSALFAQPSPRAQQFPLDLNVVNFAP